MFTEDDGGEIVLRRTRLFNVDVEVKDEKGKTYFGFVAHEPLCNRVHWVKNQQLSDTWHAPLMSTLGPQHFNVNDRPEVPEPSTLAVPLSLCFKSVTIGAMSFVSAVKLRFYDSIVKRNPV